MVSAGIMCQIYSMSGSLRKLSSGENVKWTIKKGHPIPFLFVVYPVPGRAVWSTLHAHSNASVYLPSLLTDKPRLFDSSPPSIFLLVPSLLLSVLLQYLSVRVTCQFSNEGVDINPWRPGGQGSERWPQLFKYNKSPLSTLKKQNKIKSNHDKKKVQVQ